MGSTYYLAAGDAEALGFVGRLADLPRVDCVPAHDMITVPHLTSLPDTAEGKPTAIDLSVATQIWPNMPQDPSSDLSWMAQPLIERIADTLRDRVAGIDLDSLASFIDDWIAEVNGSVDPDACPQLAADLIALARRGRDRQLRLYNWYEF